VTHFKIVGGTKPDKRLCDSCRNSMIMTDSTGREHIKCIQLSKNLNMEMSGYENVPGRIVECSEYKDKNVQTLYELNQIAWVLEHDEKKKPMGFKPPMSEDERIRLRRAGY